ncbi:MAG: FliH/SctL family protein [Anaerolineales bacterium]
MKSLPKVNPNDSLPAWNPPDLNVEASARLQNIRKEKILSVFQNEDGASNGQKVNEEKITPHQKESGKRFTSWQPDSLDETSETKSLDDDWAFIEVSDTPFDRSWKVQKPNFFSDGMSHHESQGTLILERARLQAEEIILAAQAEADGVLLQAQAEVDEQKQEGYQQGRNEARAELDDAMKTARAMVEEIQSWKAELVTQSEQILVEMLKDISKKMFGEGVRLDSQNLHNNLNRIMENAHGLGALKIFINPSDARLLDPSWDEQQMLALGEQVKIVPSGNILPGGCLIKGNIGTVDGRVETQLNTILKTFDESDSSGS